MLDGDVVGGALDEMLAVVGVGDWRLPLTRVAD